MNKEKYLQVTKCLEPWEAKAQIISKDKNTIVIGIESLIRLEYEIQDDLKKQAMKWVRSFRSNKGKEVYFVMLCDIHNQSYIA